MKKILFVGSRFEVFTGLHEIGETENCKILALQNSYLSKGLDKLNIPYQSFSLKDKKSVIQIIASEDFDILISNGFPFILPISTIKKEHQIFINIHPSYLPYLKGKTQMNGALFYDMEFLGATMHFMDDGIDTGNIIERIKILNTPDLDIGLVYYISYELEKLVFLKGWQLLKDLDFKYEGTVQENAGTVFNRELHMMIADVKTESNCAILKKVRVFGVRSQGVEMVLNDRKLLVFEADQVTNTFLLSYFEQYAPGDVALAYDEKLLIKTKEGLLRIKSFRQI